jgi:hypothetical protein
MFEKLAPAKTKRTLSLAYKYAVCNKACPKNGVKVSLRQVAREYNVQPSQICRWKQIIDKINLQLESDDENTLETQKFDNRACSKHHTCHEGCGTKHIFGKDMIQKLKCFYDNKRKLNESVGTLHLRNEACKLDPTNIEVNSNTLRMRIYCLFKLYRRATHKAQNTKHCKLVIKGFQEYVNNKIIMLGCPIENVYNADQTNVYFSLESVYTYDDTGSRAVSVKACDSNQQCTVMLAASVAGEKVIPYIVYKGKK